MAVGALFVVIGLLVVLCVRLPWLGRLPGDIRIERDGTRICIPIATCLVIGLILTALATLVGLLLRHGQAQEQTERAGSASWRGDSRMTAKITVRSRARDVLQTAPVVCLRCATRFRYRRGGSLSQLSECVCELLDRVRPRWE